jgi:hypothetical protein
MEWDHFAVVKKQFVDELIQELKNLEFPPEWRPNEVLGYVIRKIEDKGKKI